MQNFGRGMWRRVGDYERIQTPQVLKNNQIQKYLEFIEYKKSQQRQLAINAYRNQILNQTNSEVTAVNELELEHVMSSQNIIEELSIVEEAVVEAVEQIETVEPVDPIETVEPVDPIETVEPVEIIEPVETVKPLETKCKPRSKGRKSKK